MSKNLQKPDIRHLPPGAARFITLIIKKMRYRKKVRADVLAELAAHFEDALRDCKTDNERTETAQNIIEQFGDPKLLAVLLRRAKKRCRPLWRTLAARIFQTIGVLILCLIFYCVYISLGRPTIAVNYIEQMTSLARPAADESLNAAPLLQKAIDAYKTPPEDVNDRAGNKISLLNGIDTKQQVTDLTPDQLIKLRLWISENNQAIAFYKQAAQKPCLWWNRQAAGGFLFGVLMPELPTVKDISNLLSWQAKLLTHDGDPNTAFDNITACYRIGALYKGPHSLIEQLVALAIQRRSIDTASQLLANTAVQPELLESFQNRLQQIALEDTYIIDYQVERFWALDFLQRCYTDNGSGSGHMIPQQVTQFLRMLGEQQSPGNEFADYTQALTMSLTVSDRSGMRAEFEKVYKMAETCARKTPYQIHQQNIEPEMGLADWSKFRRIRYWPIAMLTPVIARVSETAHRAHANTSALITTIAILRYKDRFSHYPDNLNQLLDAGLLKSLPMDPYSDKPLVYRRTENDFILYSLGADFHDNGGSYSNWGKGPNGPKGDQVFRPVETYQQIQQRERNSRSIGSLMQNR